MSATRQKIPGPDHPITIEPHDGRVVVRAGGETVADTTRALELHEAGHEAVLYVPMSDIDQARLVPSDTTTYCPYKGDAAYHSIRTQDDTVQDALWSYPQPYDAVAQIGGHAAFYADRVQIEQSAR